MNRINILKIKSKKYFVLMILWIILIYYFSSQNATNSTKQSLGILSMIENLLHITINHGFLREFAHFTLYSVLGLLTYKSLEGKLIFLLLFGVFISISDELFQGLIDGRFSSIFDVFVDSSGYIIMILTSKKASKLHNLYKQSFNKKI